MKEVFTIVPGGNGPVWVLVGIVTMLAVMASLFGVFAYASRYMTFEISGDALTIKGCIYGRRIAANRLDVANAHAVDLTTSTEIRLTARTNGAGLPGFAAGWYALADGRRALAFVTDRRRVACVPTRDGYVVLMSVPNPDAFVATLRRLAGG